MQAFGGDIICESSFGGFDDKGGQVAGWTKFFLLFPEIDQQELNKLRSLNPEGNLDDLTLLNNSLIRPKRILIVDDERINILTTKAKIEKNFNIVCDHAVTGFEAIDKIKSAESNNYYDLILMDIEMPELDGIKATSKIKEINSDIIVIAQTSLTYEDLNPKDTAMFDYYLEKPLVGHILLRTISKFASSLNDNMRYLGHDNSQFINEIKNKKILLVDDQPLNLSIAKRKLESMGMDVVCAHDGAEMVEIFKQNIVAMNDNSDENLGAKNKSGKANKNNIDLIVTDINMPKLNGDDATSQIRLIEKENNVSHKNQTPIIAITGDGQPADIKRYFAKGMNDYYIKGDDIDKLIRMIAIYLTPKKLYITNQQNIKNVSANQGNDSSPKSLQVLNQIKLRYFNQKDKQSLLKLFKEEGASHIKSIKTNIANDNLEIAYKEVHALKGIAGNIGAEILHQNLVGFQDFLKLQNLSRNSSRDNSQADSRDKKQSNEHHENHCKQQLAHNLKQLENSFYDIKKAIDDLV